MKKAAIAVGAGVNLSLIVTPFLDMSFQILAFFIMTYHPSHLEGHINGNLLPPSNPPIVGPDKEQPGEPEVPIEFCPPDDQESLLLKISTKAVGGKKTFDGEPRLIMLKDKAAAAPERISEGDTWQRAKDKLKAALVTFLKTSGVKAAAVSIKLDGDNDLKHQYMMDVFDVCRQAGYHRISFVAPAPDRSKE